MRNTKPKTVDPRITRAFGADYAGLYLTRMELLQKIKLIKQRLSTGFSEPLQQYLNDLLKEDVALLCRMIEISCSKKCP